MTLFKGAATALITPFKDGKIDYVSMGKLIEWQIAEGIDALVVCGTTGEASTLSPKEKIELRERALRIFEERNKCKSKTTISGSKSTRTLFR